MKIRLTRIRLLLSCCCLLTVMASLPPFAARADEASKLAVINEIFSVTHVDTLMQQTLRQMEIMQKAQIEKMGLLSSDQAMREEVLARTSKLLSERLSWEKLKPAMTKLYSDNFSEEELSASLAFYKTPAGQAILTKMPVVMTGAVAITQQQVGDLAPEISRIVQEVAAKHRPPKASPSPTST